MLFGLCILSTISIKAQLCYTPHQVNPALNYIPPFTSTSSTQSSTLRLKAHIVVGNTTLTSVSESQVFAAVRQLNKVYSDNPTDIQFYLDPCINYIDDHEIATTSFAPKDYWDTSTLPSTNDAIDLLLLPIDNGINGGRADGIAVGSRLVLSGFFPETTTPLIETNVLSHEIGHVLGLLHTFGPLQFNRTWRQTICCGSLTLNGPYGEPAGQAERMVIVGQNANGDNIYRCNVTGDNICDTQADPTFSFTSCTQTYQGQGCPTSGSAAVDCVNEDWNGDPYMPTSDNLMDYTSMDCLLLFTNDQMGMMSRTITDIPAINMTLHTIPNALIISGTAIINTPVDYSTDVIIPSGATLQVDPGGTLHFAPGTGIIVQPGGRLVSNGGIFTKLDCASVDSWKGIKIFEDSELSLTGESIVEYAEVGVALFHEFNSSLLPDIEINQATFTHCDTAISYYSTVGVSPTPSQLVLNNITIDQCGTGFTSVWADGFKITNTVCTNCTVGVDIYKSRGVEVIAGGFEACEEGVKFFNSETPQLSDLTFTACGDGVALDFVDGALMDDCSYQNVTEIATHLYNSDATITSSNYTDCAAGVVIDGTGFGIDPSTIGESEGSNFFLNVEEAVNLHGAITSVRHDIQNNYFEDCYLSMLVNGLSTCRLQNNDVFYGDVGTVTVNTGNEENLILRNSLSSIAESPSISVFTNDETRYLYNCYSDNPQRDIHVYLASVAENQWPNTGVASGNEFSKIDGVPSIDVGVSVGFNYYVLDEHFVNPASVYYPTFAAGQTTPQGFDLQPVLLDEESDCGSGNNIQPPTSTCNCAKSAEENWAILTQLYGELTEVENNENLEEAVKAYQIRKLDLCIARIWRCILWWDYDNKGLGDQGEDWVTDTDTVDIPSIRVLAVQLLLRRQAFSSASAYLATHTGAFGADGTDFEALIPLSIQQYTNDSLSTSDLLTIEAIATDSSSYSGLASAMYYQATGIRLIPQWGTSPEQRSIGASQSNRVQKSLTLFPNPANDQLNIIFDSPQSPLAYQIIKQMGEVMRQGTLNSDSISLEGLNSGLYVLRVGDSAKRFVKL